MLGRGAPGRRRECSAWAGIRTNLNGREWRELQHDAPAAVLSHTANRVLPRVRAIPGAHRDQRPIAVDFGGVPFGLHLQREAAGSEHLLGRDFPTSNGAGPFGALGEVAARFAPQQLVGCPRGLRITVHAPHARDELFDDLLGAGVYLLALAGDGQERREEEFGRKGVRHVEARCTMAIAERRTWPNPIPARYDFVAMRESHSGVRLAWPERAPFRRQTRATLETDQSGDPRCTLVQGDNLAALSALAAKGARVTLAYLDPPFLTGREHVEVARSRGPNGIVRKLAKAFDDRWDSLEQYLSELGARITLVHELLAPEGCLILHVDPKTSHYAKVLCDEIFGARAFASEIVWRYRRWPSKTRNFQRVHDVLLRYVRDPDAEPRFRQLYEPLAASTEKTWGTCRQRAVVDETGRRRRSSVTEAESPGTPLGDVWDISIIAPVARERTGYPTQKPEALLSRIVEACTEPGDTVLDPYMGSGTMLAVSARLGRQAIGIDENPRALEIARARLEALGCSPRQERVVLQRARPGGPRRVA